MSVDAVAWAKKQRCGSGTLKAVLVVLADYADDTGKSWPSQKTLSDDTEFGERAIRNALADLERMGLIRREVRRRRDGTRSSDTIQLLMRGQPAPRAACAGSNRHEMPVDVCVNRHLTTHQPARGAGPTSFEPPYEQEEEARARSLTIDDGDRLFERLKLDAIPAGHPVVVDIMAPSTCLGWLVSGYDEHRDIRPAFRKAFASSRYRITRFASLTGWVSTTNAERIAEEAAQPPPDAPIAHRKTGRRTNHDRGFVHIAADLLAGDVDSFRGG